MILEYGNIQLEGVDFNNPTFKMVGGMSIDDLKIKYNWFFNAEVKDAVIGEDENGLVWYSGDWICGTWETGTWYSGIFHNGRWKDGQWYSYDINDEEALKGKLVINRTDINKSLFVNGTWEGGTFNYGIFGSIRTDEEIPVKPDLDFVINHSIDYLLSGETYYYTTEEEGQVTTNLFKNPTGNNGAGTPGSYTPGWDVSLHPTAFTVSNWSGGYNSGVKTGGINTAHVGYHAQWVNEGDDGSPCMKFIDRNDLFSLGHRWLGISQQVSSNVNTDWELVTKLKTVTLSWDQKVDDLGKYSRVGFYHKENTVSTFGTSLHNRYNTVINQWERMSFTYTVTEDWDSETWMRVYFYGHNGDYGTLWIDNPSIVIDDEYSTEIVEKVITIPSPVFQGGEIVDGWLSASKINGGNFRYGFINNSLWYDGNFYNGYFLGDIWYDGEFLGGDFSNGIWKNGKMTTFNETIKTRFGVDYKDIGATWENGTFMNAEFHSKLNEDENSEPLPSIDNNKVIWYDGDFVNGEWYGGTFINGKWDTGTFYSGIIHNIDWYRGHFDNGIWLNGIWRDGTVSSGLFKNIESYNIKLGYEI